MLSICFSLCAPRTTLLSSGKLSKARWSSNLGRPDEAGFSAAGSEATNTSNPEVVVKDSLMAFLVYALHRLRCSCGMPP
jgi:hypothetical protein